MIIFQLVGGGEGPRHVCVGITTVEAGLGVTLQSRWALHKALGLGSLKLLSVEGLPFKRSFHILLRHGDLRTRTIEVFLQTLRTMTSSMLKPEN